MAPSDRSSDDIAIVGMAALFPGAGDLDEFWQNIVTGRDVITEVPPDRWDPVFYDPDSGAVDRFYCRRGGFLGDLASFDPTPFGIMPNAVDDVEPDQLVALRVARSALDDAGGDAALRSPERTAVIVGRGGYLTAGVARLEQRVRTAQQLVETVRSVFPDIGEDRLAEVKDAFTRQLGPTHPESAIDLVPNLVASRIANRLDLRGPAYTVDGACASSLLAVDAGIRELQSGRSDLVLAGGVHLCHDVTLWSVFSQLGALSPSEVIRPFDRRADGLLIGEGSGMVVLKRRADAERDGDRIYALVAGLGVSSDGRDVSLMKPSVGGQLLALERAWADAGLDPAACGLIEAHGTATPTGDAAELETLAEFFGDGRGDTDTARFPEGGTAVVGSVKSMIGHAMPAAGAAGLIKAALAVYHGVAPPTLHCEEPDPRVASTRFVTSATRLDWAAQPALRVAAVNAFGFGGINTHAVLTAHPDAPGPDGARRVSRSPGAKRKKKSGANAPAGAAPPEGPPGGRVVLLAAHDAAGLLAQLDVPDLILGDNRSAAPGPDAGPYRLALVDPKPARLDLARRVVTGGRPWRGRNDVWFSPDGLLRRQGKLAFVFPGVEPNQDLALDDVARFFGVPVPARLGESDLERQSRDILANGRILQAAMDRLGVQADAVAGHSLGEWSGLIVTGMVPDEVVDELSNGMLPTSLTVPDVGYLMVGASAATAAAATADLATVEVTHDNCPHQSIVCGDADGCAEAARRLRADGVLCQELPIRSGFHSPAFAPFLGPFREAYDRIDFRPPSIPLWSATTAAPYPVDAAGVRELSLRHLVEPVRFRQLAEALYDQGFRVFVQMGAGSVTGFLDDTLHGREFATLSAGSVKRSGMAQVLRAAAGLWSEGAPVRFDVLDAATGGTGHRDTARPAAGRPLRLGVPLVHVPDDEVVVIGPRERQPVAPWATVAGLPAGVDPSHPVIAAYQQVMTETVEAGRQVMEAWAKAGSLRPATRPPARSGGPDPVPPPAAGAPTPPPVPAPATADGPVPAGATAGMGEPRPSRTTVWNVSVATHPFLLDHCFYRQPDGWPVAEDRFPVVPMTMLLDVMGRAAVDLVPGMVVAGFDDVRALRWLSVEPPVELTIRATVEAPGRPDPSPDDHVAPGSVRVNVSIDGYSFATVLLSPDYLPGPAPRDRPLFDERDTDISATTMYADRWMFHGPGYQGVTELGPTAEDGIRGVLVNLEAPGSLLDCAGQLMGYWAMRRTETDRLALPTSIRRIRFHGPFPEPGAGTPVPCTVWITEHDDRIVRSDMELLVDGRVWARIDDWEDRRFESDEVVWPVLMYPESNVLAEEWAVPGSEVRVQLVRERWSNSASRDLMMRRYLGVDERAAYGRHNPRSQRTHLLGRMAAKDAARRWHWAHGGGSMHPVQVTVANEESGRPTVSGPFGRPLAVSIAHTQWVAVAAVSDDGPVGVDIETIVPRDQGFVDLALTPAEQALRPAELGSDEWVTRAWTAKEAVSKALGTGFEGRPKSFEVRSVAGDRLEVTDPVGGRWTVAVCRDGGRIVAVTIGGADGNTLEQWSDPSAVPVAR